MIFFFFYNFVFWRMFIFGTDKKGKGNNWVRTFHYGGGGLVLLWGIWGDYGFFFFFFFFLCFFFFFFFFYVLFNVYIQSFGYDRPTLFLDPMPGAIPLPPS